MTSCLKVLALTTCLLVGGCFRLFETVATENADRAFDDSGVADGFGDAADGAFDGRAPSDSDVSHDAGPDADIPSDTSHDSSNDAGPDTDIPSDAWHDAEPDADIPSDTSNDAQPDADWTDAGNSPAVAIAAGGWYTCALLESGAVKCWGLGADGQLGYGNVNNIGDDELPSSVGVVPLGEPAERLAVGGASCAPLPDGNLRCWGRGGEGQLGYGETSVIGDDEPPSSVGYVPVGEPVVQVSAIGDHTCAVLQGGNLRCWGRGLDGQLGYGNENTIGDDELPSSVGPVSVGEPVVQVDTGGGFTCAVLQSGDVRCWGNGEFGRLGYGNETDIGDDELPSSVGPVPLGEPVRHVATGGDHTCALLESGDMYCWGSGTQGQLGYGNNRIIGDNEPATFAGTVPVGGPVSQIDANGSHTCALLENGDLRCWGFGGNGRLGYGNTNDIGDNELPSSVEPVSTGGTVVQIALSSIHTCALLEGGDLRCWGMGTVGSLGYGNTNDIGDDELPSEVEVVPYR